MSAFGRMYNPSGMFQMIRAMWPMLVALASLSSFAYLCEAQVVSPELRRLSSSVNQFGIDALKALDKVEPPDRVLVFCPICLSSTLMMIMMGSSKHQVVSSLRHALYVWSMRPEEINRSFKDLFEHIDLNQVQLINSRPRLRALQRREERNIDTVQVQDDNMFYANNVLSLPKLIYYKEIHEKFLKMNQKPWWKQKSKSYPREVATRLDTELNSPSTSGRDNSTYLGFNEPRDLPDLSQMNAFSGIYLQRGLTMNYNYNLLLRRFYKTNIHPVDFNLNGEETRNHINSLVAANTEGKIKDLVKRNTLDPMRPRPKIMMICTFHFRGTLDVEVLNTKPVQSLNKGTKSREDARGNFYNVTSSPGNKVDHEILQNFIETKAAPLKYNYIQLLDSTVVEIPFSNRILSLLIVMPVNQNASDLVLTKMSAQVLSDILSSLVVKKISLQIPIIKFDRGPVNVDGLLKEMNLDNLFLGGNPYTTETGLNKWMRPSDILHETSIDIGTVNPGSDQVEDRLKISAHDDARDANQPSTMVVKLDKTFYYFVFDLINGLVLTMGRIRQ